MSRATAETLFTIRFARKNVKVWWETEGEMQLKQDYMGSLIAELLGNTPVNTPVTKIICYT